MQSTKLQIHNPSTLDRVLHLQYQDVTWDSSNKIQSRKNVDKSDNFEILARIKRGSSWCIYKYDFIKQTWYALFTNPLIPSYVMNGEFVFCFIIYSLCPLILPWWSLSIWSCKSLVSFESYNSSHSITSTMSSLMSACKNLLCLDIAMEMSSLTKGIRECGRTPSKYCTIVA